MKEQPLLSIAIATKNRVSYCIKTIESILKNTNSDFELIIQDNTDNRELEDYVKMNISDDRLIYQYTPPPFSSMDNFNAVLDLCRGKYVCMLGDDDGITENLFKVVEWADKKDIDSVCPIELVHYVWPNENTNGKMVIPYFSTELWINEPLNNLQDLVEDGIIQYMKFNLPKLYHGIVKMECLTTLKNKTGYFLGGLSPDIYASIALSSVVKKHVALDFPITIAGACPKSTTVDNMAGKHSGRIENAPHFRNRDNYIWDQRIPKYYSVQTIWAESACHAIMDHQIDVDLSKLNLTKMLAGALIDSIDYKDLFIAETIRVSENKDVAELMNNVKKYKKSLRIKQFLKSAFNRIPRKYFYRNIRIENVLDIEKCTEISNNELIGRYSIDKILNSLTNRKRKV